jgi:2-keto-4-pentenoate hydratase/2-oxohepta-3-ene-1,7-dioic acid hydratase in catechol pathway
MNRPLLPIVLVGLATWLSASITTAADPQKFCRFERGGKVAYGLVEGQAVVELEGSIFGDWKRTAARHALKDVKLLVPTQPTQVLALAGNYKSHIANAAIPEKFKIPQPFFKSPSSLAATGENIVLPKDAGPTHYEAELVIVIGKKAKSVTKQDALNYVFGVTVGNDVSERYWQNDMENKDIQWWRAKGSDTFGPCGPFITSGLKYDDLKLTLRQNGQVKQEERTSYMIHDVATTVSFISQYITLQPGDLIFTGTPGTTEAIKEGDVIEVELEGVGVLTNKVVREK